MPVAAEFRDLARKYRDFAVKVGNKELRRTYLELAAKFEREAAALEQKSETHEQPNDAPEDCPGDYSVIPFCSLVISSDEQRAVIEKLLAEERARLRRLSRSRALGDRAAG